MSEAHHRLRDHDLPVPELEAFEVGLLDADLLPLGSGIDVLGRKPKARSFHVLGDGRLTQP